MFRNYLTTALNNLARNRLYAAITILGLSVAFAVAILVGQFVRNELTYDQWIQGHGRVFEITSRVDLPGQKPILGLPAPDGLFGRLRTEFPGVATVVRIGLQQGTMRRGPGDRGAEEWLAASVDPDFFKVLPLPALAGDPASALQQPDTVVLTRRMARKYFGRDVPIGRSLETQDRDGRFHAMRVTAVLRDFPVNTTLGSEIFASGRSAWSRLANADTHPLLAGAFHGGIDTYVRLAPGVGVADLQHALDAAARPDLAAPQTGGARLSLGLTPVAEVHWLPSPGFGNPGAKPSGDKAIVYGIGAVAALMVLVAAINFVTLMTARAARRGVEVGVRKATGARRSDLVLQFMGEALIQVAVSVLVAAAMAEVLIKPFDALVQRDLSIDFVHDPALLAGLVAFVLAVGVLAAIYPALVLSSFRPQAVLKGGTLRAAGSPLARATMVAIQFAVLVGLIFMTTTIYRQTRFALSQGIGAADRTLIVEVPIRPGKGAFLDEVRKLPGVSAAVGSASYVLQQGIATPVNVGKGRQMEFWLAPTDFGFLELNGVRPLAGRLFSRAHGKDGVLINPDAPVQPPVVINEAAARALGYANAQAAIGKPLAWTRAIEPGVAPVPGKSEIIGVVPDLPETVRASVDPKLYFVDPKYFDLVSIKLTGQDVLGTMRAMASVWKRTGDGSPFNGSFLSQLRLNTYAELVVQGEAMAICAGLAILIACLGLFALAAFMAERRTKEIGIRKALGASTRDVVLLLLWQFTPPVLCAAALALPVGFWAMHDWLSQFAYRVPLSLWTFALAAATAVVIAWLTVAYQSYVVARARPAGALQYE